MIRGCPTGQEHRRGGRDLAAEAEASHARGGHDTGGARTQPIETDEAADARPARTDNAGAPDRPSEQPHRQPRVRHARRARPFRTGRASGPRVSGSTSPTTAPPSRAGRPARPADGGQGAVEGLPCHDRCGLADTGD